MLFLRKIGWAVQVGAGSALGACGVIGAAFALREGDTQSFGLHGLWGVVGIAAVALAWGREPK